MPRRRQTRRRNRAERREREAAGAGPPTAPGSARAPAAPRDISWTGLGGGVTGLLGVGQSAVFYALGEADTSPWWSVPLFLGAAVYIPAIWVSVRPTRRRRDVLRGVLAVSLVVMVAGAIVFDPAIFGLLLIPSSLLAIAAGLLFSGPRRSGGRV